MQKLLLTMLLSLLIPLTAVAQEAYAVYNNGTLTFYYDKQRSSRSGTKYALNTGRNDPGWYTDHRQDIKKVVFTSSFSGARPTSTYRWFAVDDYSENSNLAEITGIQYLNTSSVTTMEYMFRYCKKLASLDVSKFNTSKVTDMSCMFWYCSGLTSLDLSHLDTRNVTDMSWMFIRCTGLKSLDLSTFNTGKVTDMQHMFDGCTGLTSLDLSNFNTSMVTSMSSMFFDCSGLKSLNVGNFDTSKVTDISDMFWGCSGLTSLDLSKFNTSKVTDMSDMFRGCSGLKSLNVGNFDTSKVTNMNDMFGGCSGLTSLDLSNFNTSNVTSMNYMFKNCSGLKSLDLSNFDTSNVTSMACMFENCSGLTSLDLSNFNTNKVTDMLYLFLGCSSLTRLDVNNFNTSNVTRMVGMFEGCSSLTSLDLSNFNIKKVTFINRMFRDCSGLKSLDLSNFDTSNVTSMYGMFEDCSSLTSLDLSKFNTSKVTDMSDMFRGCSGLTSLDVSNFDTSKVTSMYDMFYGCNGLTSLDVSNFDTSNVTHMGGMFYGCGELTNLDLGNFNTSKVTRMYDNNRNYGGGMFQNCTNLKTISVGDGWNTDNVTDSEKMFLNCTSLVGGAGTKYDANHVDKAYAHIDGGVSNPGYLTGKNISPTLNLQEFINANAGATGVVTVDLSKFYDVVREVPLYVSTGASYRFINGTLDRATNNSNPVMQISQGSKVEIGEGAVVTGRGNWANGCETIRLEGGTLNITQGVAEGSLGAPANYLGNPWQSNAVLLTSPYDHFILSNGELYGLFSCTAEGADIQFKGGKMMGFGLRNVTNNASQQSPRRATPMGSRSPSINTYSNVHLKATTSEDYTWGYIVIAPGGSTEADHLFPFHITLHEHNALYLQQSYEKGFAFTLYDKHEGDVIAVGENYNITQADVDKMTAKVNYTAGPPYTDDREVYLELKNNKLYLHFVSEEICSEDYLQQRLDEIAAQKPAEPVELTICPDGLTLTKSIHVDRDCKAIITGGSITSAASIEYSPSEGLFFIMGELGFKDISLKLTNDSKSDGCLGYFWLDNGKLLLGKGASVVTNNGTVVCGLGDLEMTDAVIQAGGEELVISDKVNAAVTEYVFLVGEKTYCNGKLSVDMKTDANTGNVKFPIFRVGQIYISTSLDLWAPKNMLQQLYLHKDATIKTYTDAFVQLPLTGEWEQMTLGRAFITSPSITLEDYSRMTFSGMPTNRRAEFVANSHQVRLMSASQLTIQTQLAVLNNSSAAAAVTLNLPPEAVTVVNQSATVNHKNVTFSGMQSGSGSRGRLHFADGQTLTITSGSSLTLTDIDVTGEGSNNGFIVNGKIVMGENVHVSDLPCLLHVGSSGRIFLSAQPVSVVTMEFIGGIANGQTIVAGTDGYQLTASDLEYIQVEGCELQLDEANNRIIAVNATGIESIAADTEAKDSAGEYYDLSGRRVISPRHGAYILRKDGKTRKIYIK